MKAMILAAGLGQRMRPLTLLRAKPALPVLNRPLIQWTLERLSRAGVREVVVNLHHLPDTVVDAVRAGRPPGLRVRYSREPRILGTGGGPRAVRDLLGREPVILVNGDVLFDLDLRRLVARHVASGARATLALRPNPGGYSSVVSDRRGRILSIAERPTRRWGTVSMFASLHVIDPSLLDRLPAGASDSVRDLYVPLLAEGAHLHGVRTGGAWYDLGRPSLYRDVQLRLLRTAGRRDGTLAAPGSSVAAGARVLRSVLGADARVDRDARVERSVLWEGATVDRGARVLESIVTSGGIVREGGLAEGVVVLPWAALRRAGEAGGAVEKHGDMAWVRIS